MMLFNEDEILLQSMDDEEDELNEAIAAIDDRICFKNENYFETVLSLYDSIQFMEHFRVLWEVARKIVGGYKTSQHYLCDTGPFGRLFLYVQINCLCQDAKRLAKQKGNLEVMLKKFEAICTEVRQKLKSLPSFKVHHSRGNPNLTINEAIETRDFLKYTWSLANSSLDRIAKKRRFMSIRGVSAVDYITELTSFSDYIQLNYGDEFNHVECSALYTHLTRQFHRLLVPELIKGDGVEFSTAYLSLAMPAMATFISIINTYVGKPRLTSLNDLFNEVFSPGPAVSNRPCRSYAMRMLSSLLRGDLVGLEPIDTTVPVVEGRPTNFYYAAAKLAHHLLKSNPQPPEPHPSVPLALLGPGLLEPRFQSSLPSINKVPPAGEVLIQVPEEAISSTARAPTPRGRGRPRKRGASQPDRIDEPSPRFPTLVV